MIHPDNLTQHLKEAFTKAHVEIFDKTGGQDHYIIYIRSSDFAGKTSLAQHRLVQKALAPLMASGELHAAEIKTAVPEQA
jgi:stress-induced morphogen